MKKVIKGIIIVVGSVVLIFSSWIFLHVFAVLGVFLALMYPVWFLFLSQYNLCLVCRIKKEGDWCPLCQQKVSAVHGQHVVTTRSALLNSGLILLISLVSIGAIFGEGMMLNSFGFTHTSSARFVIPAKEQHAIGETFPMKLTIKGITMPINAVQADIAFDPSKLAIVDISTVDSFATIFIQKEINNEAGYARLTGGLPNPGFNKQEGLFGTVYFRAKAAGPVSVKFLPTTMALANDGNGTNVLKDFGSVSYLIVPRTISQNALPVEKDQTVLGTSSSDTNNQMIFYGEDSPGVIFDKQETQSMQQGSEQTLLDWLTLFDTTITTSLGKLLHPFGQN